MNYDVHIYFRNDTERSLAESISNVFELHHIETFPFVERPVGPHPFPMFESHISDYQLEVVHDILSKHRGECPVLIHEKTGDHLRDHTEGATWVGESLELDLDFIRKFV